MMLPSWFVCAPSQQCNIIHTIQQYTTTTAHAVTAVRVLVLLLCVMLCCRVAVEKGPQLFSQSNRGQQQHTCKCQSVNIRLTWGWCSSSSWSPPAAARRQCQRLQQIRRRSSPALTWISSLLTAPTWFLLRWWCTGSPTASTPLADGKGLALPAAGGKKLLLPRPFDVILYCADC